MNSTEVQQLVESGALPQLAGMSVEEVDGHLAIAGMVAFPVLRDCTWTQTHDFEIHDEAGILIGVCCGTAAIDPVNIRLLTEWQLVAYLTEVGLQQFDQPMRFRSDYFIVASGEYTRYDSQYRASSGVWGGYIHVDSSLPYRASRNQQITTAVPGVVFPTPHHRELLQRAIEASHPFERYLKYYHLLELLFDWVVVRRVQTLAHDLSGIGLLMSSYQAQDQVRLREMVREFCSSPKSLYERMALVGPFQADAQTVFETYSKSGNPINDAQKWTNLLQHLSGGYSVDDAKSRKLANSEEAYRRLLQDVTSYWIFRVRCCIAHHRIGEFLLSDAHLDFVIDFAEPLIKETVLQVLRSPTMQAMVPDP
jgi:hypothetical protein